MTENLSDNSFLNSSHTSIFGYLYSTMDQQSRNMNYDRDTKRMLSTVSSKWSVENEQKISKCSQPQNLTRLAYMTGSQQCRKLDKSPFLMPKVLPD